MYRKSPYVYLTIVGLLLATGIWMLSSASAPAISDGGEGSNTLLRQCIWLGVGIGVCFALALTDYHRLERLWWVLLAVSAVLLLLCYIPPIGHRLNGSARWVGVGQLRFQPSDLAKFAVVVFLARWYATCPGRVKEVGWGFLIPLLVLAGMGALIGFEVDIGTTTLMAACAVTLMFVAGVRLRILVPLVILGMILLALAVWLMPERSGRFLAFTDLEKYKEGAGFQQYQGLIALGSGGLEGLGLGNGRQKHLYVPYANTDFIFTVIGEEMGAWATLGIVSGYLAMFLAGTVMCLHARDRFGTLLGFGLVTLMAYQAAINIGVTTAMLPNKGLPLPLVSAGGSNLLLCLATVGVVLSIHRQGMAARRGNAAVILRAKISGR